MGSLLKTPATNKIKSTFTASKLARQELDCVSSPTNASNHHHQYESQGNPFRLLDKVLDITKYMEGLKQRIQKRTFKTTSVSSAFVEANKRPKPLTTNSLINGEQDNSVPSCSLTQSVAIHSSTHLHDQPPLVADSVPKLPRTQDDLVGAQLFEVIAAIF